MFEISLEVWMINTYITDWLPPRQVHYAMRCLAQSSFPMFPLLAVSPVVYFMFYNVYRPLFLF